MTKLLVLLYASCGRLDTRVNPRCLCLPPQVDQCAFARGWESVESMAREMVRGRALLRPHAWDCSASGTSQATSSVLNFANYRLAAGTATINTEGQRPPWSPPRARRAPPRRPESEGEYFRKKNWKHQDVKPCHGLHGYDPLDSSVPAKSGREKKRGAPSSAAPVSFREGAREKGSDLLKEHVETMKSLDLAFR